MMHRRFLGLSFAMLVSLAFAMLVSVTTTGTLAAQPAETAPASAPGTATPAGGQEATPSAPASTCEGMIAEAELLPACEARLDSDTAWREKIGIRLGRSILDRLAPPSAESGQKPAVTPEQWIDDLVDQVTYAVHDREARVLTQNNRHVIMAYAVLWGLVVVFVAFMWVRQRSLKDEIARLQREVAGAQSES